MSHFNFTNKKLARCTDVLGGGVAVVALAVICGWFFDIGFLKSVLPGAVTMKFNTAVGLLLGGIALRGAAPCRAASWRITGRVCAILISTLGMLTLGQYVFDWDLGIDNALFPEKPGASGTLYLGRMAPQTALCFSLFGLAYLVSSIPRKSAKVAAQLLNGGVALVALASVAGHLYGALYFYGVSRFSGIAVHTTFALLSLCAGLYCSQHEEGETGLFFGDGIGGVIARRLLTASVLVPLLLGWLRLRGQDMKLFDAQTGVALLVVSIILVLAIMVGYTAKMVNRLDLERREAQAARDKSNEELQHALEEVGTLRGLLPMCSWCKNVRDDSGYWGDVSEYITAHMETEVTHGICPVCARQHFAVE